MLTNAQRLAKQLEDLEVPFVNDFSTALASSDHVVDAIFGSSEFFHAKSELLILASRLQLFR